MAPTCLSSHLYLQAASLVSHRCLPRPQHPFSFSASKPLPKPCPGLAISSLLPVTSQLFFKALLPALQPVKNCRGPLPSPNTLHACTAQRGSPPPCFSHSVCSSVWVSTDSLRPTREPGLRLSPLCIFGVLPRAVLKECLPCPHISLAGASHRSLSPHSVIAFLTFHFSLPVKPLDFLGIPFQVPFRPASGRRQAYKRRETEQLALCWHSMYALLNPQNKSPAPPPGSQTPMLLLQLQGVGLFCKHALHNGPKGEAGQGSEPSPAAFG